MGGHDGKCSACQSASRFGLILPSMTKTPGAPSATHARTAPHRAISLETREGLPCYRPPCGGRRRGPQQVNISESVGVPLGIGRCLKYAGSHPQALRKCIKLSRRTLSDRCKSRGSPHRATESTMSLHIRQTPPPRLSVGTTMMWISLIALVMCLAILFADHMPPPV
jgi:hypothetical protein